MNVVILLLLTYILNNSNYGRMSWSWFPSKVLKKKSHILLCKLGNYWAISKLNKWLFLSPKQPSPSVIHLKTCSVFTRAAVQDSFLFTPSLFQMQHDKIKVLNLPLPFSKQQERKWSWLIGVFERSATSGKGLQACQRLQLSLAHLLACFLFDKEKKTHAAHFSLDILHWN